MPTRLAHITNHFFDLPSQDAQVTAGSPHPVVDFTTASSSLYQAALLRRHGGRSPAAAATTTTVRRRGGSSGVGTGPNPYGQPSSPSSSAALTPPQSPALPIDSPNSFSPISPGSPSASGMAATTTSTTRAGMQQHPHPLAAGAGAASPRAATRATRYPDGGDRARRHGTLSSPLFRAPLNTDFETSGVAPHGSSYNSFSRTLTGAATSPSAAARAAAAFRMTGGPSSRVGGAAANLGGLPSPTRLGAASSCAAVAVHPPTSNTSVETPSAYPVCDPTASQYTEADAELLLHPLLHYVQDENTLRFHAAALRRRRKEAVTFAVDALEHPSCGHACVSSLTQHQVTLQHDYVLHARGSRLIASIRQRSSRSPVMAALAGHTRDGQPRGRVGGGAGEENPSAGTDKSNRLHADLRPAGPRSRVFGNRDGATLPRPHGASPADSLTSAPGAAASLYLLEMTGQLSGESGEQLSEAAAATAGGPSAEAVSSRADGNHNTAFASSPTLSSRNGRRRRSSSRLPPASSHSTMPPPADSGDADTPISRGKRPASSPPEQGSEGGTVADEGEIALLLTHNVFANFRTLPLHFAHRSYELLPARYRAGLDAISAEVLLQQQQMQRNGGVVAGLDGGGGSSPNDTGGGGCGGAGAINSSTNTGNHGGSVGGRGPGSQGRRADASAATAAAAVLSGGDGTTAGYDGISYIGVSYLAANGDLFAGPGVPGTRANSTAPSPHPSTGPRVGAFGESGMWPGVRGDLSASPLPPSRAMAERGGGAGAGVHANAMDDDAASSTANAQASSSLGPVAGSPLAPSLSTSVAGGGGGAVPGTLTTSPNTANAGNSTNGGGGSSMLHHMHHTIQSFIARGEREVALHYIIAIAPYRFPYLSNSDRVLALFNQIRFFFPSPRFSTVLMAMEAWRSLYRPSVGASASDYAHMAQELLTLIETYLCHGRTYAEYVSGLLMLRVVLSLAMENSSLGSRNSTVMLQHRALVRERLPTLLLAVWVTLMDYYTIDDLPQPPRRALRDLAASAMQDALAVALELQMVVPVQNVVASAVNLLFNGPHTPTPAVPAVRNDTTGAAVVSRHEVPPTHFNEMQPQHGQRRRGQSPPLAEGSSISSSSNTSVGPAVAATTASSERSLMPVLLNVADRPHIAHAETATMGPRSTTATAPGRSPAPSPPPPLHTAAATATVTTSESPAPTASAPSSHGTLTRSVWRSLKRAARRVVSAALSTSTSAAGHPREGAESAAAADATTRVLNRGLVVTVAGPQTSSAAVAAAATTSTATVHIADPTRRLSPAHPSPPLLIDVPDDMLLDMNTDQAVELLATPSTHGWGIGSLNNGALGFSSPQLFHPCVTFTPDVLGSAMMAATRRDEMPHSPILPTAPSTSATFHMLWQPTIPSSFRLSPAQRQKKGGFVGPSMSTERSASSSWADAFWGSVLPDGGVNRDALWTMPLALGLRAAGRPLTLESTVAAACLTIGAFLCAWRLAGHDDEAEEGEETEEGTSASAAAAARTKAKASAYDALVPQVPPPPPPTTTSTTAAAPANSPTAAPGVRRGSCELSRTAASSMLTYCGTSITSSPGCRLAQDVRLLLPLVTEEQVRAVVTGVALGNGDASAQPVSPTSVSESTRMTWDEAAVGRPSVSASMLSVTLAAMTSLKPTAVPHYDRSDTAQETDPEWQSLSAAARNMFLPPIVDVEATASVTAVGDDGTTRALAGVKVCKHDRPNSASASPLPEETSASAAEGNRPVAVTSLNLLDAPESVVTAVATKQYTHSRFSSTASTHVPSLRQTSVPLPGTTANVDGARRHVDFRPPTAEPAKTAASMRTGSPARSRAAADTTTTTTAPPLFFFLPSWTVARLMDRCLHPTWDTDAPSEAPSQVEVMDGNEAGNAASPTASNSGSANVGAPLTVSVEAELMLTSLVPLLSQYYAASFSETQLMAATQLLVNRAVKVMRTISQATHRSTDDATVAEKLFGVASAPTTQQTAAAAFVDGRQAGANAGGTTTTTSRQHSVVDPGSLLPSCAVNLCHDSAVLDGTELLNAVLFIGTVAEPYPALFETIVSHKLYPLLHHAMRLMAFEEEPQFWLPTPFPSTAAWTASSSPPPPLTTAAVGPAGAAANVTAHPQWMMLTAARSMFQRISMPALVILAHNMPSLACARQCAPLVDRLVQVGLRQPFCIASVTTASSICAVFPSMARICQAEVARSMSVVLSTADDVGEGEDRHGPQGSAVGSNTAMPRHRRATGAPAAPPPQPLRPKAAAGGDEAKQRRGAAAATTGGNRLSGQLTPVLATIAATAAAAATVRPDVRPAHATTTATAGSSFVPPSSPTHLQRQRRPSAVSLCTAQRRRAAQVRLLKHRIFRSISFFPSSWEGTTLFFLEFCLPYLRHPDAQLRLACVQACTSWPLSDCWHSVERTMLQLSGSPHMPATMGSAAAAAAADGGGTSTSTTFMSFSSQLPIGGAGGGVSAVMAYPNSPISSASFLSGMLNTSLHGGSGGVRRATVSAAVTRVPLRDARSEGSDLGHADSASSPCYVSFANAAVATTASAFPAGPLSAVRGAVTAASAGGGGGVAKQRQTLTTAATIARSGAGLPMRDSSGLLGANSTAGNAAAVMVGPTRTTASATLLVDDGMRVFHAASPANSTPVGTLHTVQHHGRTHINALREIVHHLVEVAVCDPEPLIRRCALESLTPETYQLLYPHETVLHQLFIVLWDSYLPNRVKAAQLLCALAPLNPPFIYPRLREVMVRYIADMTSSVTSLSQRDGGRQRRSGETASSAAAAAVGIYCMPCRMVPEDSLYVLSHIASRLKQSTPLYLSQLLSIVYSVLRCASSGRGSVLQAMHLLIFLRDDCTQDQSALFDPFVDLIADQLADGEGDTPRVLAAVAALQTLLQSAELSQCSPQSLPVLVECLHSLLYRKPSVGTDFSMAVLQLLGTISNIEPWQPEMPPRAPALLRRPQNRYAIPPLSSLAGVFGKPSAMRSFWPAGVELADNAHQALGQLQKVDRFMPFTAMVWPDTVLRALMRTASGYVNGTMSLTQDGLGECLLAIMNILTNTMAVRHLDLYLPGVLTLVIDLLERKDARPLRSRAPPSPFFMTPKNDRRGTMKKEDASSEKAKSSSIAAQAGAGGDDGVRGRMHGTLSENLWLLFLRSLFDLVLMAGRRIAPMYPLLNVFLHRSWQQTTLRGMVQCCEVLDALCWSVPDLLRVDCDTWITKLLSALMHHDAFVLTHRRAHETPTSTPTTTAAAAATAGTTKQTRSTMVTTYPALSNEAERQAAVTGAGAAVASTTNTTRRSALGESPMAPPLDNTSSAAGGAFPRISVTPFASTDEPSPTAAAAAAATSGGAAQSRADEVAEANFEDQLKLVYRALTVCLTSMQPISSGFMRRLVCVCLSDCLKSSHVPQMTPRRAAGASVKAAHIRPHPTTPEVGGGAKGLAPHTVPETADLRSSSAAVAATAATPFPTHGMFDLMADPHEELISFINTCVCGPLMEYMMHTELETVSMKITKNVLARLESLSMVHEEALRRVMLTASLSPQQRQFSANVYGTESSFSSTAATRAFPHMEAAAAAEEARDASKPTRVVREACLREARELLYAQRLRQTDDPSLGTPSSAGGQTPTRGAAAASAAAAASNSLSGSTSPSPMPLGARTTKEVLWFSNAPLSRMWVQSTDQTTTVRRYFPFDAAQTSWETEGEVHLLGCLFAAAAWRHPSSTVPFIPVLYTFVAQRFGAESLVMSYTRCVCSRYYDLCLPLLSASDEEAAVANWVYQQQQQQQHRHGTSGGGVNGSAGNGSDGAFAPLPLVPNRATTAVTGARATPQDTDSTRTGDTGCEGATDVILRHPSAGRAASPALMDNVPPISFTSHFLVNSANTAAFTTSSTGGSRTGSWEAEAPLRTVMTAEGELSSITSLTRGRVAAAAPPPPPSSASSRLQTGRRDVPTTVAATAFNSASPASASVTSAATNHTSTTAIAMGGAGVAETPASHGFPPTDWTDTNSNNGRRSAEMNATAHFPDRDGDGDRSGREEHQRHCAANQTSDRPRSTSPFFYGSLPLPQQQQQQQLGTAGASTAAATTASTDVVFDFFHSPSTHSPPSTRDQSPTAVTLPIPVGPGGLGGAAEGRTGVTSGRGTGSGPIAINASFYPGSFFRSSFGDAVGVGSGGGGGGGGGSGPRYPNSASAHSGDGPGPHHATVHVGSGGVGGNDSVLVRQAAGSSQGHQLPFPVAYTNGMSSQPARPPSMSDLPASFPMSATDIMTATVAPMGFSQPPSAMLMVGSFGAAAPLNRHRSLLARPSSLFNGTPPAGSAGGGGVGGSPLWHPPPMAAPPSSEDLTYAPYTSAAAAALPHYTSPLQPSNTRRRTSPLLQHPPLPHNLHRSIASAAGTANLPRSDEASSLTVGAFHLLPPPPRQLTPIAPARRSSGSNPGTPVQGLPVLARSTGGLSRDAQGYLKTPPIGTRSSDTASPSPLFVRSTSTLRPVAVTAGAAAAAAVPTLLLEQQPRAPLMHPATTTATAGNNRDDVFVSVPTAVIFPPETAVPQHRNSLILFFESHRLLRAHGWRSWWEQFCLFMVECSQDYCVKACETFARNHHVAFACTELLPLALLSTLPSCTVAELTAWLQALRTFYVYHTDPCNSVPQQVTSGVAQVAHAIRLHRNAFFPPEVVSQVIDVWLPDGVVADLAHHSLNPPLRILYLEQDLARAFSWNRAALLMSAMDDVTSSLERKLFVQDRRFQRWLGALTAGTASATYTTPPHDSPVYPQDVSSNATTDALRFPRTATLASSSSSPSSSFIDAMPPSALELLGFYRAAALEYVRVYTELRPGEAAEAGQQQHRQQRRGCGADVTISSTGELRFPRAATRRTLSDASINNPEKAITGAMRCYTRLFDFEAVLRLWDVVKQQKRSRRGERLAAAKESAAAVFADERSGGRVDDGNGEDGDVAPPAAETPTWSAETARYVALAAQALSRWAYVSDTARFMQAEHLSRFSGTASPLLERIVSPGQFSFDTALMESGRMRHAKSWSSLAVDGWGHEDDPAHAFMTASSTDAAAPVERSDVSFSPDAAEGSLMEQQQQEIFLGAALVAAHDYEGAKQVLSAVRSGLRDSYAVFHTSCVRIKLEWNCIFQQLSDLEEGIHTLEPAAGFREDGTSATTATTTAATAAATAAAVAAGFSSESETTCFTYSGPGSPVLDREVHGRLYSEATIRRLRSIVCRPLSATTSPLQRFMMIAARSAIAPISWQLDSIITLCEMLERNGQPMRAVQTLHRYSQQATTANAMTSGAAAEYKQQLHLETLRRMIHNLPHEAELREMYACVQTALRQDLWQSRRAAAQWGQSSSSPVALFPSSVGANQASTEETMDPLFAVISDAKRGRGALLDALELGPSLTSYQVDLLLLSVGCRRRLARVLLRGAPLAQRAATGGVRNHRGDVSAAFAVSSPGADGSSQCVSLTSSATPVPSHLVSVHISSSSSGGGARNDPAGQGLAERGEGEGEARDGFATYPHSPMSSSMARQLIGFPTSASPPSPSLEASSPNTGFTLVSNATPLQDKEMPSTSFSNSNAHNNAVAAAAAAAAAGAGAAEGARRGSSGADGDGGKQVPRGFRHQPTRLSGTGEGAFAASAAAAAAAAENGDADDEEGKSAMESLTGENALFVEYYLLEHVVTVTHYVPSVWREFGLVLFDICLAIHSEWKVTADEETKQNFLAQSAKAIHGLQLAAQLWESGSASALGRGVGLFSAMAQRRHRHARSALPSAHLLLKALHLAITCELIVQNDAQASAVPVVAGAVAGSAGGPMSTAAARSPSPSVRAEGSLTTDEEDGNGDNALHLHAGFATVSPSTVSASPSNSQHTFFPYHDSPLAGEEEKVPTAAGGRPPPPPPPPPPPTQPHRGGHGTPQSTPKKAQRKNGGVGGGGASAPSSSSAPPTAPAGKSPSGGFACLDFSAASYAQWAALAPVLLAAATCHPTLYTVLRDMCVRSRHFLRQLVFMLIANFEHGHDTLFVQRTDQVSRGRGLAGTRTVMWDAPSPAHATAMRSFSAAAPRRADDTSALHCAPSKPATHSARGISAAPRERHFGRRVTSVPDLWEDDAGDVEVVRHDGRNGSGDSSRSGSCTDSSSTTTGPPSIPDPHRGKAPRRTARTRGSGNPAATTAANTADGQGGADTPATTEVEYNSSIDAASSFVSCASEADDEDNNSTADAFAVGESALHTTGQPSSSSSYRPRQRVPRRARSCLPPPQRQQQARPDRATTPVPLQETLPSFDYSPNEERVVRSLLLADVAAASPGHQQHIHEAMQLRGFVRRAWDVEATYTWPPASAQGQQDAEPPASATASPQEVAPNTGTNPNRNRTGSRPIEGASSPILDTDVAFHVQETDGALRAMELVLGGHCPLPVPLWYLSSVFGMEAAMEDDSAPVGPAAATAAKANRNGNHHHHHHHGSNSGGGNSNAEFSARKSGNGSAFNTAGISSSTTGLAAGSTLLDKGDGAGTAGHIAHDVRSTAQEASASPPPTAAAAALFPDVAPAGVLFSPSTVPGVVHVRRYLVPHPAPHHRKEELIFLVLSDGAMCRLRHVAPAPPRATAAAAPPQPRNGGSSGVRHPVAPHERSTTTKSTATATAAVAATTTDGEEVRYVVPHCLMEQVVSMVLSHLPLTNLQRPFVLPLGLQDYMTLLPEQTSGSVFGATVTAAVMHAGDKTNWQNGVALLTGESSAALSLTASLLTPSSASSSARGTPSLHHLMDDYAVHLRVREMAQAAHDAVQLYPTSDFEATYIAAETGRGPGAQSDNSFPFNWAYGYPASAPPSEAAMIAALNSTKYHDVVRQRKMNELRYDQLVAMAYNKGNVEQLVAYVRELLAARPSPLPWPVETPPPASETNRTTTAAASAGGGGGEVPPTNTNPPLQDPAEDNYARQQLLYAHLATLPRTEAHLRWLLGALEEAMCQKPTTATSSAPSVMTDEHHHPRGSATATAAPTNPPGNPRTIDEDHTSSAPPAPPHILTPPTWQACGRVLFRVESSRCKSALADAFSADSSDASHWLDVRRIYAKELAEWSVVQYLFDMFGRECGDVMVNTYDGHVAMHAMGRHSLQKAWGDDAGGGLRRGAGPAAAGAVATPSATAGSAPASPASPAARESDPLTSSPFPTRDPSLFRLTPVLQCGLPMQSPYALFQYRAASVLGDIYLYVRDLAGIATYGVDRVKAFAYTTGPTRVEALAGDGVHAGSLSVFPASARRTALPPHREKDQKAAPKLMITVPRSPPLTATTHASRRRGKSPAASPLPAPPSKTAEDSRHNDAAHPSLALATPPLHPQTMMEREVLPASLPSSSSATPPVSRSTTAAVATAVARADAQQYPCPAAASHASDATALSPYEAEVDPTATSRPFLVERTTIASHTAAASAACDGGGGGVKDAMLAANTEGPTSVSAGRQRNRRSGSTGAVPLSRDASTQRGERRWSSVSHPLSASAEGDQSGVDNVPQLLPPPPPCFDASSLRLKLSYDILLVLHADVEQQGRETMLRLLKTQREATEASWPRAPPSATRAAKAERRSRHKDGVSHVKAADAEVADGRRSSSHVNGNDDRLAWSSLSSSKSFSRTSSNNTSAASSNLGGKAEGAATPAPAATTAQSAYDFVTRLVAAATDEGNLLGVDDATPHLWRRWAPHW
ncbi:hypothetical protein ABB37_07974 [Leptomonas pyrrhocoris]|uniref:Uncharacterized protein n=1 Tax=Leptomonas pyrrhocoris TaxID=157538 RepID=A0A0M9FUI4_LEPPY|nr:hypothetical protein ABB37_07974 [Leptomonas pyrrhocoris]KPA76227.1 hypothetical protein ABB37_07974 [Leptomonas pyrrhocoris]|eukprot:XP_015654666.1 hypothetical protein ABB37_07974 [Leptomonas pyrrhocoris]